MWERLCWGGIKLGTLVVGKEPQDIVKIGSARRSVDYMQLVTGKYEFLKVSSPNSRVNA